MVVKYNTLVMATTNTGHHTRPFLACLMTSLHKNGRASLGQLHQYHVKVSVPTKTHFTKCELYLFYPLAEFSLRGKQVEARVIKCQVIFQCTRIEDYDVVSHMDLTGHSCTCITDTHNCTTYWVWSRYSAVFQMPVVWPQPELYATQWGHEDSF